MKVKDLMKKLLKYNPEAEIIFSYYIQDDPGHISIHGRFDSDRNVMIVYHNDQGVNDKIEIYNAFIRKV